MLKRLDVKRIQKRGVVSLTSILQNAITAVARQDKNTLKLNYLR